MRNSGKALLGLGGCLALLGFIAGPLLAYTEQVAPLAGFGIYAVGLILGVIATVASMVVYMRKGRGWGPALGLFGIPGALALIYTVVDTFGTPAINDISTDRVFPPAFVHATTLPENAERDMAYPKVNTEIIERVYPEVRSLAMNQSVDDVLFRALEIAESQPGWEITARRIEADVTSVEGFATSGVFRFVDDFIIRITRAKNGGSVVDMRSKSRDGKSDLGVNAQRIQVFFNQLQPNTSV